MGASLLALAKCIYYPVYIGFMRVRETRVINVFIRSGRFLNDFLHENVNIYVINGYFF